jgi:hypothetical protein
VGISKAHLSEKRIGHRVDALFGVNMVSLDGPDMGGRLQINYIEELWA